MTTVIVTKQDIAKGIPKDCWKCPVALALGRATGMKWMVKAEYAYPLKSSHELSSFIWFSDPTCIWIRGYDQRKHVKPFCFQL